jgi:dihydrofolate synthase/folylpolyglutamate synthase
VCQKIAKALELGGHKVGLLISPHISSYRERMSINGELISEQQVEKYLAEVLELCDEHDIPANFFEITTGCAFRYFSACGADVVVLETGLGGLLDSTNVITSPVLSIITSIGLEHTAILGNTVELIGAQKAGIIKKNCPVLVGPNVPHKTIRRCALEREAEGYYTCEDVLGPDLSNDEKRIINGVEYVDYDVENSRTARAALTLLQKKKKGDDNGFPSSSLSEEKIIEAIRQRPPCRFQEIKNSDNLTILDIAHNPPAMKTLVAKLEATYPEKNKRYVVGFSADKDIAEIGNLLLSVVPDPSNIHLVEAANFRAAKIEKILEAQPRLAKSNFTVEDRSITTQVKTAMQLAAKHGEVLVVCGSIFLMSEARQALGIEEAIDSDNITKVAGIGLKKKNEEKLIREGKLLNNK